MLKRRKNGWSGGIGLLLLALIPTLSFPVAAEVTLRLGSGPLMRSVQNEVEAAITRAASWLMEQQAADGSWGGGDPRLTAIAALALYDKAVFTTTKQRERRQQAYRWLLAAKLQPESSDAVIGVAWREYALTTLTPPDRRQSDRWRGLGEEAERLQKLLSGRTNTINEVEALIVHESGVALLPGQTPFAAMHEAVARDVALRFILLTHQKTDSSAQLQAAALLGAEWTSPAVMRWRNEAQRCWWLARALNRGAGGVLYSQADQPLDWRRDLADTWVNSQRIAPRGGGYWVDAAKAASIETTAFGMMLLREL